MKMMRAGLAAVLVAGLWAAASVANACEQRASAVPGHWEWQGNGHVWVPDHDTLPRNRYAWRDEGVVASSAVSNVAHDDDKRDAKREPRDLDRRLTR